jgi:hypothetical protein
MRCTAVSRATAKVVSHGLQTADELKREGSMRYRGFEPSMKRSLGLLMAMGVMPALASDVCELCGTWKSHEQRTLQEMSRSKLIGLEQRALFGSNFFGRLVVEIRSGQRRSYFDDEDLATVAWEAHSTIALAPGVYSMKSKTGGEEQTRNVRVRGDCFLVEQPELGFGEWFCRVTE